MPGAAAENIRMIRDIAIQLGPDLLSEVVFVGGAVLVLLITDPAAHEVRPTKDVDVIVVSMTYASYVQISEQLRQRGFQEDQSPGAPTCRWNTAGLVLDVMPTSGAAGLVSDRWYDGAFHAALWQELPPSQRRSDADLANSIPTRIRVISGPYFLGTKLDAFAERGKRDITASHDMEDIVTLLNGRAELVREVAECNDQALRRYIAEQMDRLLKYPYVLDAIEGHLPREESGDRIASVIAAMRRLAEAAI